MKSKQKTLTDVFKDKLLKGVKDKKLINQIKKYFQ